MRGLARRFVRMALLRVSADDVSLVVAESDPFVSSNSTDVALCGLHRIAQRITMT